MNVPSNEESISLLNWAGKLNSGAWVKHSHNVARAAAIIADNCGLDNSVAYSMGLLHDIGRYKGVYHLKHIIHGYNLMIRENYDDIARICLTHSFPTVDIESYSGQNDCDDNEIDFIESYLKKVEFDDYDKLIQLCDALGDARGIVLLETRLIDVARRNGINDMTINKWNAFFDLKDYFDNKCGRSIYTLFYDKICKSILS